MILHGPAVVWVGVIVDSILAGAMVLGEAIPEGGATDGEDTIVDLVTGYMDQAWGWGGAMVVIVFSAPHMATASPTIHTPE